jgi:N-methylhydantoinase A
MSADEVAAGVMDVTTSNMHAQLMPLMARKGIDPRDFALLAYGGAGPTHAVLLAREVGVPRVIVPPSPGTLCALGCLVADLKRDSIKTLYVDSAQLTPQDLEREFEVLEADAREWLGGQRATIDASMTLRSADMRYKGQSFDITVPLPAELGPSASLDDVRAQFHRAYERIYGLFDDAAPVEIINVRVTAVGVRPKPSMGMQPGGPPAGEEPGPRHRRVREGRAEVQATVFERAQLPAGHRFSGPAIVEAPDTTVYVPAGFEARVDAQRNLVISGGPRP